MVTVQVKLSVENIIASLPEFDDNERKSCSTHYLNLKMMRIFKRL